MEAVTSMIKQIVNKHSQQNVAYARTPNVMLPRVSLLPLCSHYAIMPLCRFLTK